MITLEVTVCNHLAFLKQSLIFNFIRLKNHFKTEQDYYWMKKNHFQAFVYFMGC